MMHAVVTFLVALLTILLLTALLSSRGLEVSVNDHYYQIRIGVQAMKWHEARR